MMRHGLTRRRFLRGVGGTTLALPFLEAMVGKAHGGKTPQRYVFMFAGFSVGSNPGNHLAPAEFGALDPNSLPIGMQPLGDHGVTDVISMVSGLSMPSAADVPPGGRPTAFHSTAHRVLATGTRQNGSQMMSDSSDQLAARYLAEGTLQDALIYGAQPAYYYGEGDGGSNGVISARRNDAGEMEQLPPITSPRVAYESLFEGFIPPDPELAAAARRELAMRKSVVDLVSEDAESLISRLGKEDSLRMQRHFDEIRSLEGRLEELELPDSPACVLPEHPGDDPPIGSVIADYSHGSDFENDQAYSNEALRAQVMVDLIHMALACDISRVASFMITQAECFMNVFPPLGIPSDVHEITHGRVGGGDAQMQALGRVAAWHLDFYGQLTSRLRDTLDIEGNSLLESTALAFAFEGGWGYDTATGSESSPHSTENMCMLLGGKAGGLHADNVGRHIDGAGRHPTAILNTALQAVGVPETLGEVSGGIDELLP